MSKVNTKDKVKGEPETHTMPLTDFQIMQAEVKKVQVYADKLKDCEADKILLEDKVRELEDTVKILTPIGTAKEISKDDELNRLRQAYKAFDYEITTTNGLTIFMQVNPMARDVMIISITQK